MQLHCIRIALLLNLSDVNVVGSTLYLPEGVLGSRRNLPIVRMHCRRSLPSRIQNLPRDATSIYNA